jgi:hypothetical protein
VELEEDNIIGSYTHVEHDACIKSLPNGSRLNQIFEKAGIMYTSCPQPSTDTSAEALRKRKVDAYGKPVGKRAKVAAKRKATPVKTTVPKAMSDAKRPSDIKLALVKPVKKMKKFALASSTFQASGPSNARASSSQAPSCHDGFHVGSGSVLRVQESLPSVSMSLLSGIAPRLTANPTISFAVIITEAAWPLAFASAG